MKAEEFIQKFSDLPFASLTKSWKGRFEHRDHFICNGNYFSFEILFRRHVTEDFFVAKTKIIGSEKSYEFYVFNSIKAEVLNKYRIFFGGVPNPVLTEFFQVRQALKLGYFFIETKTEQIKPEFIGDSFKIILRTDLKQRSLDLPLKEPESIEKLKLLIKKYKHPDFDRFGFFENLQTYKQFIKDK